MISMPGRDMPRCEPCNFIVAIPLCQIAASTRHIPYCIRPTRLKLGILNSESQCIHTAKALPTISLSDTCPQTRLSLLLSLFSPPGRDVCMLIGGADGLDAELLSAADLRLSLSALTLPHAMARVLLVEALYRAWSVVAGHPYHRG